MFSAIDHAVTVLRSEDGPYVALTGGVLLLCLAFGLYGLGSNFLPTAAVAAWNEPAAWLVAAICALCALYLMLEVAPAQQIRNIIFAMVLAAFAGFMAVSDGVPTMLSHASARPDTVVFTASRAGWGGKRCHDSVIVTHPDYVEQQLCGNRFTGKRPKVGDRVALTGQVSDWGLRYTEYRVVP